MPRPKLVAPVPDPTLPFTEIAIDGKTYKMCFTYGALASAEAALVALGYDINLLTFMLRRNFSTTREMFAASLMPYQPELFTVPEPERKAALEFVYGLVRPDTLLKILTAVTEAWEQANPEAVKADPQ